MYRLGAKDPNWSSTAFNIRISDFGTSAHSFQPEDTARDRGEALSIRQMIDAMIARHSVDRSRVYVVGLSAGGAMAAALLAAYPERFAGGAIVAGVPYGCANTVGEALRCMSPGDRSGAF